MPKYPRLSRRGATYQFRAKVPPDLLPDYAPRKEITFSLRTKDPKEALVKVRIASVKLDQEFATLRAKKSAAPRTEISDIEVERLATIFYHDSLSQDDQSRFRDSDNTGLQNIAKQLIDAGVSSQSCWTPEQIQSSSGLSDRDFIKKLDATDAVLEDARIRLARSDTSGMAFEIDAFLEGQGVTLPRESREYRKVSIAVLKAHVKALEAIKARNEGRVVDTPPEPEPLAQPVATDNSSGNTPLLSQAFGKWKTEHRGPSKTAEEFKAHIDRFISLNGDLPIDKITKSHVRDFKDAMLQFPSRPSTALRKLSVMEVIKSIENRGDILRLSPKTVNEKCLASLKAVLNYCVSQQGYIDHNPADNIRAKAEKSTEPTRIIYSDSDIRTILSFPVFTTGERPTGGAGEAAKWLPILAMYSGARLDELGCLTVEDVGKEADVHFIFIRNGPDGRRVKNASSVRKVPIHSKLIGMGFLEYVESVGKEPSSRVFPLVRSRREKQTAAWSQWWGRYARKHGVTDTRKNFHSFRHTVKRKLRDASVDKTLRDALMGHEAEDTAEIYGLDEGGFGISLSVLAEAVEKITYSL